MTKDLYILYDPSIENSDSLSELDKILVLAGFDLSNIKHITLEDYKEELIKNNYKFFHSVLAVNNTYKEINVIYSEKLDIPLFDFFSKEYVNYDKKIALYGLLFSISTIFLKTHKKYSWGVINKFKEDYDKLIQEIPDTNPTCDYLETKEPVVEESIKTSTESAIELVEEIKQEVIVAEQVSEETSEIASKELVEVVVEQSDNKLSYEYLLTFYNETKEFIKLFKILEHKVVENEIQQ